MKGLVKWIGLMLLVTLAFCVFTMALLEVDERCRQMTGGGGDITAVAQLVIEKIGSFG